jgi:galactoside O-acetyltransferase
MSLNDGIKTGTMFYSETELDQIGLRRGAKVKIHRSALLINPTAMEIGSNVRIDAFCVLSADRPLQIGSHCHIATATCIFGGAGVKLGDFVGLSNRVTIFTASDDYVEGHLTNPTIPEKFKKVARAPVELKDHVIVGCGSVIMPGVVLERGVAVGALSFVNKAVPEYHVVSGHPARKVANRDGIKLTMLEAEYLASLAKSETESL